MPDIDPWPPTFPGTVYIIGAVFVVGMSCKWTYNPELLMRNQLTKHIQTIKLHNSHKLLSYK